MRKTTPPIRQEQHHGLTSRTSPFTVSAPPQPAPLPPFPRILLLKSSVATQATAPRWPPTFSPTTSNGIATRTALPSPHCYSLLGRHAATLSPRRYRTARCPIPSASALQRRSFTGRASWRAFLSICAEFLARRGMTQCAG